MGFVIGLAGGNLGWPKIIGRGVLFGLIVSFAFYSSTGFTDVVSFLAGIVYMVLLLSILHSNMIINKKSYSSNRIRYWCGGWVYENKIIEKN